MRVAIIGLGSVGTALSHALVTAGADVLGLPGRDFDIAALEGTPTVVLAVPDHALAAAAERIALVPGPIAVLHVAGARTPEELAAARSGGHAVGAMHPLVSFADRENPPSLVDSTFVIDGDEAAVRAAVRIAERVGARALLGSVHGPAYHAAAAMVANGAAALAHAGTNLLLALGWDRADAEPALAGLLRSVASNVTTVGVPAALTGPIKRGDATTVSAHREALRALDEDLVTAYDAISQVILRCAVDAGLEHDKAERVLGVLTNDPTKRQ